MNLKKISKIRLKPKFKKILQIIGSIFCVFIGLLLFYSKQIYDLKKIGYSKKASREILFSLKKDYVLSVGKNESLNAAFESSSYKEENLDHYRKIRYFPHKHFIININKLLKKGYNDSDINIIFSHGNDEEVSRFTKREKIRYLEEFYSISYAKLDNYDRYVHYSDDTGEDEETTVLFVNLDMDKNDYEDPVIVKNFSTDMLVNKHRSLTEKFVPNDLVTISKEYASEENLQASKIAVDAFIKMSKAADAEGYSLVINSAYRSYQEQLDLIDFYMNAYGQNYVDKYVAKAGFSEHQTGLAFDIGSRKTNVFQNSKEYTWMEENAYKYGFIRRFTKKYEFITGFRNEPWHFRYVGEKIAKEIHENGMSYEEYWACFVNV